jgi:phospholipase C
LILQAGQTDRLANTGGASTLATIWDRLADARLSGTNYGYQIVSASQFGTRYTSLMQPITSFFTDAATGALPNVAYVDPDFQHEYSDSDHPHSDIQRGEALLASIYQAVTASPAWRSTVLIVTFDEWGGFFDHVPPRRPRYPRVSTRSATLTACAAFASRRCSSLPSRADAMCPAQSSITPRSFGSSSGAGV